MAAATAASQLIDDRSILFPLLVPAANTTFWRKTHQFFVSDSG